ncbi:MAG: histidine phosphatase family protein [Pseudomonadota bacterium]
MITLVRHGEAAAKWGDHPNPGLSELGHHQALAAAEQLSAQPISHILTSPMQRCQETAKPLAERLSITAEISREVSEIPTPPDLTLDRVDWLRDLMGATWADAPDLVQDWRAALIDKVHSLPDDTVVFTHFVAINAVVSSLEGLAETTVFRPTYCSQTVLVRKGETLSVQQRGAEAVTRIL